LCHAEHRGTNSPTAHSSGSGWVVGEGESIQSWRLHRIFWQWPVGLISRKNDLGTSPRSWSNHENVQRFEIFCCWPTSGKSSAPVADQQSDIRTQVVTAHGLFVSRWVAGPKNAAHIPCQVKLLSTLALLGASGDERSSDTRTDFPEEDFWPAGSSVVQVPDYVLRSRSSPGLRQRSQIFIRPFRDPSHENSHSRLGSFAGITGQPGGYAPLFARIAGTRITNTPRRT
jgi:hypothetical protein